MVDNDANQKALRNEGVQDGYRIDVKEYAGDCYTEVRLAEWFASVDDRGAERKFARQRAWFAVAVRQLALTCGWVRVNDLYVCEGVTLHHPGLQMFVSEMVSAGVGIRVARIDVAGASARRQTAVFNENLPTSDKCLQVPKFS